MLWLLREKKLLWPAIMTMLALPPLIALGVWQLQRLDWKDGLIKRLEERVEAQPISLAAAIKNWHDTGDAEYLSVATKGRFLHDKERYIYAVDAREGAGYHVLTPLETADGNTTVLINRGFVPEALKDPAKRASGQLPGEAEVVGLVRTPGGKEMFTPEADPKTNVWYWRDMDGLVRSMFAGEERQVAPFFLEAKAEPANPGGWPKGGVTIVTLPNRHFEYALTWFGLAAALLGVFLAYAVPKLRDGG